MLRTTSYLKSHATNKTVFNPTCYELDRIQSHMLRTKYHLAILTIRGLFFYRLQPIIINLSLVGCQWSVFHCHDSWRRLWLMAHGQARSAGSRATDQDWDRARCLATRHFGNVLALLWGIGLGIADINDGSRYWRRIRFLLTSAANPENAFVYS